MTIAEITNALIKIIAIFPYYQLKAQYRLKVQLISVNMVTAHAKAIQNGMAVNLRINTRTTWLLMNPVSATAEYLTNEVILADCVPLNDHARCPI